MGIKGISRFSRLGVPLLGAALLVVGSVTNVEIGRAHV